MLSVQNVTKSFGGIMALNDVSFEVGKGEIVGVIGPNGAGKSTLFNVVSGTLRPDHGKVFFNGQRIDGFKPDRICKLSLARTCQIIGVSGSFTVREAVLTACLNRLPMRRANALTDEILHELGLTSLGGKMCVDIGLQELRLVEFGKALGTQPSLLLLDELVAGLTLDECERVSGLIKSYHAKGSTFILISHEIRWLMALCQKVMVLNFGTKIAEGIPGEIAKDPAVVSCYLGG